MTPTVSTTETSTYVVTSTVILDIPLPACVRAEDRGIRFYEGVQPITKLPHIFDNQYQISDLNASEWNGNGTYGNPVTRVGGYAGLIDTPLYRSNGPNVRIGGVISHMGWIWAPRTQSYQFNFTVFPDADDVVFVWIGQNAISGWTNENAQIVYVSPDSKKSQYRPGLQNKSDPFCLQGGKAYPMRILWGVENGKAWLGARLTAGNETLIEPASGNLSLNIFQFAAPGCIADYVEIPDWQKGYKSPPPAALTVSTLSSITTVKTSSSTSTSTSTSTPMSTYTSTSATTTTTTSSPSDVPTLTTGTASSSDVSTTTTSSALVTDGSSTDSAITAASTPYTDTSSLDQSGKNTTQST